jgi:hypothetical protein
MKNKARSKSLLLILLISGLIINVGLAFSPSTKSAKKLESNIAYDRIKDQVE